MTEKSKTNGHATDAPGSKKVILDNSQAPDKTVVKKDPNWFLGAKKALKPFYWVSALVVLWWLVAYFKLLNPNLIGSVTLLLSALLFVLSIPMGIILKMDLLATTYASNVAPELALIFALPIVLLNFTLIGAYKGWRKGFRKPNA